MNLLNIWHSGGITETLLGFAALISGIFWYQVYKAIRSGSYQQKPGGVSEYDNMKFYQLPKFWLGVAAWLFVIAAIVFIVAPDYKGI